MIAFGVGAALALAATGLSVAAGRRGSARKAVDARAQMGPAQLEQLLEQQLMRGFTLLEDRDPNLTPQQQLIAATTLLRSAGDTAAMLGEKRLKPILTSMLAGLRSVGVDSPKAGAWEDVLTKAVEKIQKAQITWPGSTTPLLTYLNEKRRQQQSTAQQKAIT